MGLESLKMTKDIRKNIDATIRLNESLDEGPVGWAADKAMKAGQRIGSKLTWGGAKQNIKTNINVRSGAAQLIKRWNNDFAAKKMKRTPTNIVRFLAKEKDLKMSRDEIKAAWNKTPELTKSFGTFDEIANQLKKQTAPGQPGQNQRDQSQAPGREKAASPISSANYPESIEEAPGLLSRLAKDQSGVPSTKKVATQQMSVDNLRNLLINAIHVKNASDAEKELGGFPGDEEPKATKPGEPSPEEQPKPAAGPEPTVQDLKTAGAQDMDGDKDYDYDDIAATAIAQGKGEEALQAFLKKMAAKSGAGADQASLAYSIIMKKSPGVKSKG